MPCVSTTTSGTNPQQHGCANSAPDIICPPGTSIPGQFEMFAPETCTTLTSAISLQVLADGRSPCVSQDTNACHAGRDRHRASRSLSPDSSGERTTSVTLRPFGSISSVSANLQFCLENRLKRRLGTDGSTIYSMHWKTKATPAGRRFCQLVASARRISASDCSSERSGWTTPQAHDVSGRSQGQKAKHGTKHGCACLVRDAQMAGWPTPTKGNADGSQMAKDASPTGRRPDGSKATVSLNHIASLSGWPTPTTRDHKDGRECPNVPTNSLLGREVWKADQPIRITAAGQVLTGSDAGTASSGQLNPIFSLWLMGFPAREWASCAVQGMQSSRKSRQSSSRSSSARSPKSKKIREAEDA